MRFAGHLTAGAVSLCALAAPVSAADWPHLRGGEGDGSARSGLELDLSADVKFELLWKRPLGSGYSGVAVAGERAVTMAAVDGDDLVIALDPETGAELWRHRVGPTFPGRGGSDDGPSSTPTIAGDLVVALEPDGRLLALDVATGRLRWERRLAEELGVEVHAYGLSAAPLVTDDLVLMLASVPEGDMLLALDRRSGEVRWSAGGDRVLHQNPALVTLAGRRQIVASGVRSVAGLALDDGSELWRFDFDESSQTGEAIPIDDERLLVTRWHSTHLLRLARDGHGLEVEEAWSTRALKDTYAVPVRRGEYLFGFNGRFLSCVSLESGELVWKSRPPGGRGLMLLDDHLLTIDLGGDLVAVAASPEGYRESGRLPVFGHRSVMTPPSFAGGRLFVRNLTEIAAVRPLRAPPASADHTRTASEAGTAAPAGGVVARFLSRAGDESDRDAALDELLRHHPTSPIVDGGTAHFYFVGDPADLAIVGDMTGLHREDPMLRVAGTEFHYRSYPVEPRGRWEYTFKVFEESRPDPRNPLRVRGPDGERSVVVFDGWEEPDHLAPCADCRRGRVVPVSVPGAEPDESFSLRIYTPAGYDRESDRRYPLVIYLAGDEAIEHGRVGASLDALVGRSVEPLIAVFPSLPDRLLWEPYRDAFREAMDESILPWLAEHYRLRPDRDSRAVVTHRWGIENALAWALGADVGRIAAQSPWMGELYLERALPPLLDGAAPREFHIDWGAADGVNPEWGLDVRRQVRELARLLESRGHTVHRLETPGGANWTRYRTVTDEIVETFFPAQASASSSRP